MFKFKLFLPIEPQTKARPRFGKGFTYTPAKTRKYESDLKVLLKRAYNYTPLKGPISVYMTFWMRPPTRRVRDYPTVKPDQDNLIKAVFDASNGILWDDDVQVVKLVSSKMYDFSKSSIVGIEIIFEKLVDLNN